MIKDNISLQPFNTFGVEANSKYFAEINSVEELIEIAHNLDSNQQNFLDLEKRIASAEGALIKTEK